MDIYVDRIELTKGQIEDISEAIELPETMSFEGSCILGHLL